MHSVCLHYGKRRQVFKLYISYLFALVLPLHCSSSFQAFSDSCVWIACCFQNNKRKSNVLMRVNQVEQVVCLRDLSSTFVLQRLMKVSKSIRGYTISTTGLPGNGSLRLSFQIDNKNIDTFIIYYNINLKKKRTPVLALKMSKIFN